MVAKLQLPFPILSDPDRSRAIAPYDVVDEHDRRNIARPATVIISPNGEEVFRFVGDDYAHRPRFEVVIDELHDLELAPVTQDPPRIGEASPSANAMQFEQIVPYFRGGRFAAIAMGRRHPEAKEDADAYVVQVDDYIEATKALFKAKQSG